MKYLPLFVLIQLASLVLTLIGIPVVGLLAFFRLWDVVGKKIQWQGGALTWIWGNLEDGIVGPGMALTRWNAFYWSAIRNPCNNLRYVPGVSKVGRPLWRFTWKLAGRPQYFQAGWNAAGFPVLSGGYDIYGAA